MSSLYFMAFKFCIFQHIENKIGMNSESIESFELLSFFFQFPKKKKKDFLSLKFFFNSCIRCFFFNRFIAKKLIPSL